MLLVDFYASFEEHLKPAGYSDVEVVAADFDGDGIVVGLKLVGINFAVEVNQASLSA